MYTIDLDNGVSLSDLELNGNNFVSKRELTEGLFEDAENASITDSETGETTFLSNIVLVALNEYSEGWYFVLREQTEEEVKAAGRDAQILFTAIATDTLLED